MVSLLDVIDSNSILESGSVYTTDINDYRQEEVNVLDRDWFDLRFNPPADKMFSIDAANRYYSTASQKFTDTRLGRSLALNPKPQSCQYSDIRVKNNSTVNSVSISGALGTGLGRKYSEIDDDFQQLVYMSFGIAKFNSLPDYFLSAVDYRDSYIANTGRYPTGYDIGKTLGNLVMLAAFPLMSVTIWSLKFISKLALGSDSFDYYTMEPTMHMFWGGVNTLVNQFASEIGFLAPSLIPEKTKSGRIGVPASLDSADLEYIRAMAPELLTKHNGIDMFGVAVRPQVMMNRLLLKEKELYDKGDVSEYDFLGYIVNDDTVSESKSAGVGNVMNYNLSFSRFLKKLTGSGGLFGPETPEDTIKKERTNNKYTKDENGMYPIESTPAKESYASRLSEAIDAGVKDGGQYVILAVDHVGTVSESFSNNVGEIGTAGKIKSLSSGARDIRFNLAGGNVLGDTIKDGIDSIKNVLAGTLDSVTMGLSNVIQTLTGNGYADIPKKWESSDVTLSSVTYNMELRRTYNTPLSTLRDELIPLAVMINSVAPLATGKSSHTSPYLCELFCKGVQNIKMGMVTSVTISRGVGNLKYDRQNRPLGIDISFTVTDLSTILTAPVNASIFSSFNLSLDDNTPMSRYISTVASRDLLTSKYMVPKAKLKASRLLMGIDQAVSPYSWGMRTGSVLSGILGGAVADHALSLSQVNNRK